MSSDDRGKNKLGPHGKFNPIDKETYERIWEHYRAGKSRNDIATAAGVSPSTAQKYITVGDPERGFEPLEKRLDLLKKRMQAKLFDQHSKKKQRYYDTAAEGFELMFDEARTSLDRIKACEDKDGKVYEQRIQIAGALATLMMTWHNILRSLYIGEESEKTLRDIQRYTETGEVTPDLMEKIGEIYKKWKGGEVAEVIDGQQNKSEETA
jgi:hypothetical protein